MIEVGESETVLLIETAFINGEVGSIIGGKFSYVVSRVSALVSLLLGTVYIAEDVFFPTTVHSFFYACFDWFQLVERLARLRWRTTPQRAICIGLQLLQLPAILSRIDQFICHLEENRHIKTFNGCLY